MKTEIIVAIIGGVAVVAASAIALLRRSAAHGVQIGDIDAGGDVVVAGGDIVQQIRERFISKQGARILSDTAKDVIPSRSRRAEWSSFDARVLDQCVADGPRGWIFKADEAGKFFTQANDQLLNLSVKVYTKACKRISDAGDADYRAFNRIAQLYLAGRMNLRGR